MLDGGVRVIDAPDPRPQPGEALIRVLLAGICGTDLELARGYMDFTGTPGHEFVGLVEEVAEEIARPAADSSAESIESAARWVGRRVAGEINAACGACSWCERGLGRHCPNRTVLGILGRDGAHAERLVLPVRNLHEVPDTISDQEAVFIEPVAAAAEILDQVAVAKDDRVLVIGDGRLGQLAARLLATVAPATTVLGRHPEKLALLARLPSLGIVTTTDGTSLEPVFDLVVDATGSPSGLYAAVRLVKPRGTIVAKSTFSGERPLPIAKIIVDEIRLIGSRCGRFEAAIPLLASKRVAVADLVTETIPLDEAPHAYQRSGARDVLKVLLQP